MRSEKEIVNRIQALCVKHKISKYRLSQQTGIAQSAITKLMKGNTMPTVHTLLKICDVFGITLAQFFAGNEEPLDLSLDQYELLNLWGELTTEEKQFINACLHGLIDNK